MWEKRERERANVNNACCVATMVKVSGWLVVVHSGWCALLVTKEMGDDDDRSKGVVCSLDRFP